VNILATFGDLKKILAGQRGGNFPSLVNPGMTHDQAICILRRAINLHADDEPIDDARKEMMARNVLRECTEREL
jgi:hypothetical protein